MLAMFRTLPLLGRVATVLVLLGGVATAIGGAYAFVHHQGYVAGYARASAEAEAERRRLEAANDAASTAAAKRLIELADLLSSTDKDLDDALASLDAATAADADGPLIALPSASVRRLNTIR